MVREGLVCGVQQSLAVGLDFLLSPHTRLCCVSTNMVEGCGLAKNLGLNYLVHKFDAVATQVLILRFYRASPMSFEGR